MMYFERKEYLDKLISAEGNGMIKIITGIRRCGKSFLLFNYMNFFLQNNITIVTAQDSYLIISCLRVTLKAFSNVT